ncbi:MAG: transcriptional regulator [Mesorhizobium sp.]
METTVGTSDGGSNASRERLVIKLVGSFAVLRDGAAVALPQSRKLRTLLGYLAITGRPVTRERLCELFWPIPNDPRAELRWTLSKLRNVLEFDGKRRIITAEDCVSLDISDCSVDALQMLESQKQGVTSLQLAQLNDLVLSCSGEFLQGQDIDHSAEFDHWLLGCRAELRSIYLCALAELCTRTPFGDVRALALARQWSEEAPLDPEANIRFLAELSERRLAAESAQYYGQVEERFRASDVDFQPVRQAWQRMQVAGRASLPAAPAEMLEQPRMVHHGRASLAVMPFHELREGKVARSELGDALAHDAITKLARLRSLFIIARGSVFAIADEKLSLTEIGAHLGVDYVTTGLLERDGSNVRLVVEVVAAATSHLVWTETFEAHSAERFAVIDEISDGIVASIASHIESAERDRALLKHPDSLDAWENYHRGLWHMYQFTSDENQRAAEFFRRSVALDPTFSRAHAGLSFTHWQTAFQRWGDKDDQTRQAMSSAAQSLLVDEQNPTAYWSMGRALWLVDDYSGALHALQRSVELSPNFALGHYALSFVHSLAGDPGHAIHSAEQSRLLSPYDPLLFGMMGTRAMALVRLGSIQEGAEWAKRAASRPNAHVHILALAAHCLALAGRMEEAREYAGRIRTRDPSYRSENFLQTFRFKHEDWLSYKKAGEAVGL